MKPEHVFEVSWEVCNKVGGIHTVIKSKAELMSEHYGHNNYTLIGPYIKDKADYALKEQPVPEHLKKVFARLKEQGIICYYGVWNIRSQPETILLEFSGITHKKNAFKTLYWEHYQVDSLLAGWEFEEPMLFATAAGILIQEYKREHNKKILAHLHEWLAGFTLLYLNMNNEGIPSVFTTHATILGRAIAGSGEELYEQLDTLEPATKAQELGISDKYSVERACAQQSTIFTTVSEITALEAEKILGRKPEVLLYNGISMNKFPTVEETSIKHVNSKERLLEFIAYYFFPYYTFDLQDTIIFYTSGRFEHRNKGLDLLTEALRKLNEELKASGSKKTVVVFFWIPLGVAGLERVTIENKNTYYQIKNYMDWHAQTILKQLTWDFLIFGSKKQDIDLNTGLCGMFTQDFLQELKADLKHFKREGNAPISTHKLLDNNTNPLYQGLVQAGLTNKDEDRVKVVLHPVYLDGADGLLNMHYYEAVIGTHLGIFPSYYEPWGYTPLESTALAVPAITTDLAGFGNFVQAQQREEDKGIWVAQRQKKTWDEQAQELYLHLHNYASIDHIERVDHRLAAKIIANMADWKYFVKNYFIAHEQAMNQQQK